MSTPGYATPLGAIVPPPEPYDGGRGAVELLDVALGAAAAIDTPTQVQLGATVFASVMLARSRMPGLLAVFAAVGFGYLARRGYGFAHDTHSAIIAVGAAAATLVEDYERSASEDRTA